MNTGNQTKLQFFIFFHLYVCASIHIKHVTEVPQVWDGKKHISKKIHLEETIDQQKPILKGNGKPTTLPLGIF